MTLIETALVLSLTGVLLAAFVPTFLKHVQTSKLAEATDTLASLHRHAVAYYEAPREIAGAHVDACLPESAPPHPEAPSSDRVDVDFLAAPRGAETWRALGRTAPASLRYSYEVVVPEPGCRARGRAVALTVRAYGNLDGDDQQALLERSAVPSDDGRTLVPHGPLRIEARTE